MNRLIIVFIVALLAAPAFAGKANAPAKKPEDKPAAEAPKQAAKKIQHAAVGAKAQVSSTNKETEGESGAGALIDGDLGTRWSSEYSAPQRITIELRKPISIDRIKLHWEAAFATKYQILISDDGEGWTPAHYFFRMGKDKKARIDSCSMKGVNARFILIELNERVNDEWGFSLYEVEVIEKKAPVTSNQ